MLLSILVDLSFNPFQIEVPVMKKLNPITAFYLKILEFISFLLIEIGGRWEDSFFPKNASQKEYFRAREIGYKYRQRCRRLHRRY